MTREEAIKYAQKELKTAYERAEKIGHKGKTRYIEVLEMAIKALEILPKYKDAYGKGWDDGAKATYEHMKMCEEEQEPKTDGDCIRREAVMDCFKKWQPYMATRLWEFEEELKKLPSVNPQEPKAGHWEWVQYDYNPKLGNWHCSECRCVVVECVGKEEKGGIPLYKYCPSCGCCMVEPHESEKINCKSTKCENCINHNYCDYEPQESEG